MAQLGGHYARWHKLERKREILYDFGIECGRAKPSASGYCCAQLPQARIHATSHILFPGNVNPGPLVLLLSHWLAPQWAPPTSDQQWATVSGPVQPLAGATMGPSHKWPAVSEQPLVVPLSHWLAPQWAPPTSHQQWATVSGPAQPLAGPTRGPSHKRPAVSEQPLVVLLSHWLVPQWAPPTGDRLSVSNR